MKKILSLIVCGVLVAGCSAGTKTEEPTVEATVTPTVEATADAIPDLTAPVDGALEAEGVIADAEMSTISVMIEGKTISFLKGDVFTVVDGEETPGALVTVTYTGDLDADPTAVSLLVNGATKSATGTVAEDAMSTITVTVDNTDISFLKDDNFVLVGEFGPGATVTVNYEGELDGEPIAYAVIAE